MLRFVACDLLMARRLQVWVYSGLGDVWFWFVCGLRLLSLFGRGYGGVPELGFLTW